MMTSPRRGSYGASATRISARTALFRPFSQTNTVCRKSSIFSCRYWARGASARSTRFGNSQVINSFGNVNRAVGVRYEGAAVCGMQASQTGVKLARFQEGELHSREPLQNHLSKEIDYSQHATREYEIQKSLSHQNIVKLLGASSM